MDTGHVAKILDVSNHITLTPSSTCFTSAPQNTPVGDANPDGTGTKPSLEVG